MLTTVLESYRRHRFAWLFFSPLLTISAHPVLEVLVPGKRRAGRCTSRFLSPGWSVCIRSKQTNERLF